MGIGKELVQAKIAVLAAKAALDEGMKKDEEQGKRITRLHHLFKEYCYSMTSAVARKCLSDSYTTLVTSCIVENAQSTQEQIQLTKSLAACQHFFLSLLKGHLKGSGTILLEEALEAAQEGE